MPVVGRHQMSSFIHDCDIDIKSQHGEVQIDIRSQHGEEQIHGMTVIDK